MKQRIVAFDFDGVICDGQQEYFHSAWLAYRMLWQSENLSDPETIRSQFYALRPVIETGWEMVVLIQALLMHIPAANIWQDWQGVMTQMLDETGITQNQLAQTLDQVRDRQISEQLNHWLSLHHFYDGILECLQNLLADKSTDVYIITTKEARFTQQILMQQGIEFPHQNIFGKEQKQPKTLTLKQLLKPEIATFYFIEDRLQTLRKVRQDPTLQSIQLFLADWGYNTDAEKKQAIAENFVVTNLAQWQQTINTLLCP